MPDIPKIYLDNCCFNRPFDNQKQTRIQIETKAKIYIQELIINNKLKLIWSFILSFENSQNPYEERKNVIKQWKSLSCKYIHSSQSLVERAKQLNKNKDIKSKDALHIASAIEGNCKFFITTDDSIIKKMQNNKKIKVINPTEFITKYEDYYVD